METITLGYPIEVEGEQITVITLRRPKARDLKHMETAKGGEIAKSIGLIANLAELPPSAIENLDASDFQKVSDVVASFFNDARLDGDLYGVLADLAAVFHWPPSDLWELELKDIRRWHREARLRAGSMYG